VPTYKTIPAMEWEKFEVLKRRQKKIEERYRIVRAPYRAKGQSKR
jgi:hypothetical protein